MIAAGKHEHHDPDERRIELARPRDLGADQDEPEQRERQRGADDETQREPGPEGHRRARCAAAPAALPPAG